MREQYFVKIDVMVPMRVTLDVSANFDRGAEVERILKEHVETGRSMFTGGEVEDTNVHGVQAPFFTGMLTTARIEEAVKTIVEEKIDKGEKLGTFVEVDRSPEDR
jgi:hypothetical protein